MTLFYFVTYTLLTMNLHLLPKELQILISEYNAEHRPQMRKVCTELLKIHTQNHLCMNCECDEIDHEYTRYIFWKKYTFCGAQCQYDSESDIRKDYLRSVRATELQ